MAVKTMGSGREVQWRRWRRFTTKSLHRQNATSRTSSRLNPDRLLKPFAQTVCSNRYWHVYMFTNTRSLSPALPRTQLFTIVNSEMLPINWCDLNGAVESLPRIAFESNCKLSFSTTLVRLMNRKLASCTHTSHKLRPEQMAFMSSIDCGTYCRWAPLKSRTSIFFVLIAQIKFDLHQRTVSCRYILQIARISSFSAVVLTSGSSVTCQLWTPSNGCDRFPSVSQSTCWALFFVAFNSGS